jgi:hypothetical protein
VRGSREAVPNETGSPEAGRYAADVGAVDERRCGASDPRIQGRRGHVSIHPFATVGQAKLDALRARTAVGIVLALTLVSCCSASHHGATSSTSQTPQVATLPAAQVRALETALVSNRLAAVESVLATAVRSPYSAKPWAMLPPGSRLSVDGSHLVVTGSLASLPATVTGPKPGKWLLLLVREQGVWRVYGTRKT